MPARTWLAATSVVTCAILGSLFGACKSHPAEPASNREAAAPHASMGYVTDSGLIMLPVVEIPSDAGPISTAIPVAISKIEGVINPRHLPPYAGPKGTVEGTIRVTGDAPFKRTITIPFECGEAYATYGKAFREGNDRTLADAMVAVTGYEGYIPAAGDAYPVSIHGCAYDRRTLVLTYGQRIEVTNRDSKSFLPTLEGSRSPAQLVAMPKGDAVKLYALEVGHYALTEGTKGSGWMYADVFVLQYSTHAVTGLDGRYRIAGIPAGKVKLSVYLPSIDAELHPDTGVQASSLEREVEIKDGETTKLDIEFPYKVPKAPLKPKPVSTVPIIK
ncbi:MAG TPA: hypothetical protein VK540_05300 [Polyangiaceae bacterium]|nr:hypothetical protein [Polyangiaceae bacterium]